MTSSPFLPDPEHKAQSVEAMFDRVAPKYDRMNRLLTMRLDVAWRRAAIREIELPANSTVIDLACGTGDMCNDLATANYAPIGFDFSAGMLRAATTTAPLVRADVLRLPVPDHCVDAITCGFALRNFTALEPFFAECARVVRPRGRVILLDVGEPQSRLFRFGHHIYFRKIVPFIGGLLSDRAAYSYLPASTAYLPEPRALVAMVRSAGFHGVIHRRYGLGAAQLIVGTAP
jgi:demethylmenaquinone methyltransferase / 2-methoxy-6-polyprenyl-1,4-benzoquinol methylase